MLYFVAVPIGNLGDISSRALDVLSKVDIIACEDTRNSAKLLAHYNISKQLIAYHKFNERTSSDGIIKLLEEGKNIAVISDSGMPVISDPGNILAEKLCEQKIDYTVVPGANAGLCALILSGFDADSFTFVGFLPDQSKERKKFLQSFSEIKTTLIFHISPHSLLKDINDIFSIFGKRKACLVKEITKMFESKIYFSLGDNLEIQPRGEYVLIVEGCTKSDNLLNELSIQEHIDYYISQGLTKNDAIKSVAKDRHVAKNQIYKTAILDE